MSRMPTGDLAAPMQLGTQQTISDPYYRQPENQAGKQTAQLAQALSALNPGLSAIADKFSSYQTEQKVEGEETAGESDRQNIQDTVAAQQFKEQNRGTWTKARLDGYEMADAQVTANTYPAALKNALISKGLWDNDKANPQDVQATMAQVRQQYMAQGQGSGPIWQKTFGQYSEGFENGLMNQWIQHTSQVREDKAESMVGDDGTTQLLAHLQLGTAEESAKSWSDYMEKSFKNSPLQPFQLNPIKVKSFEAAYSAALNSNNPELAEKIMATFEHVQVNDDAGKPLFLAQTTLGGSALAEMHTQQYYWNRQLKQSQEEDKQGRVESLRDSYFNLEKQYDGKMPSEIPAIMPQVQLPDGTDLRTEMTKMGMDPDRQWAQKREAGLAAKHQVVAQEQEYAVDQIAQWNNKIRDAKTSGDLNDAKDFLYKAKGDPAFQSAEVQQHLTNFQNTLESVQSEFTSNGRDVEAGYRANKTALIQSARGYATEAEKFLKDSGKNPLEAMGQYAHMAPSADGLGTEFAFGDLERSMTQAYNDQIDAVRKGRKFSDMTSDDYSKVAGNVSNQFKPQFESRIQQIQDDQKKQAAQQAAQADAAEKANKITDIRTGQKIELTGEDGLPSPAAVRNVFSTSGSFGNWTTWARSEVGSDKTGSGAANQVDDFLSSLARDSRTANSTSWFTANIDKYYAKQGVQTALTNARHSLPPSPYSGVDQGDNLFNRMSGDLSVFESDDKLMDAVKSTAASQKMSTYHPELQREYSNTRQQYLRLSNELGLPTGDTSYKPSWVDWRTTPLFSRVQDVTDENVKALMKHLQLDDKDFYLLKAAQTDAVATRDEKYGPISK